MPFSWSTIQHAELQVAPQVQAKLTITDSVTHTLELADAINGGRIKLTTEQQITDLKQWLIDAGY